MSERGLELERQLAVQMYRGELVQRMVLERRYRGTGGLLEWYPETFAAWRAAHPADESLRGWAAEFCASSACEAWREHPASSRGICLEEAVYRFFEERDVGSAAVREDELLGAVVKALAVTPDADFVWPQQVRAAPGGCFGLTRVGVLHAALRGQYVRGPVTPLIAALLSGAAPVEVAARFAVAEGAARLVQGELAQRGLLR